MGAGRHARAPPAGAEPATGPGPSRLTGRKARGTDGQKLVDVQSGAGLDAPITYVANGVFPADVLAVVGQCDLAVVGVRQDITYKILDQAVITDDTGKVIYNLAQQDMLA